MTGLSPHAFKQEITTRQKENFKQSREKDWNRVGSREQGENKHKTSSTGEVKNIRDVNTSIN